MKKSVVVLFSILLLATAAVHSKPKKKPSALSSQTQNMASNAVTYEFSGGRFGDCLLTYIHAKWIGYRYQMPVLYRPFKYSEQLALHALEPLYDKEMLSNFRTQVVLAQGESVHPEARSVLFRVLYFPHSVYEHYFCNRRDPSNLPFFHMDYEDPAFKAELRKVIRPIRVLPKMELPKDCTTVALHMRRGIGFDGPDLKFTTPYKEPPLSYYVSQLRILLNLYPEGPLYVHLFTDDPNPQALLEELKEELAGLNIIYAARESQNSHNSNVLEDFFAMLDFDCLVRPESNYSICAEILGDFKAVCSVEYIQWEKNQPYVSKSRVVVKR
jgi:hypothetical protein